jgi:thiol-disulfide isomerase/thioredoxin
MKKIILSVMLAVIAMSGCADNSKKQQAEAENTSATDTSLTSDPSTLTSENEAPDFTLNDLNGKPLTLSSLRGKYVILDFWGSWCGWCIKGIPQMKEYYQKYAGKFEILGIDCNDPEEKWKAAVEKYELPWLHVYNPRGDSKVLEQYEIQGFPTKIIVGPDGKIVKTIIGEDPAFYTFLDELFK